jgi:MazG family protein
VPLQWQVAIGYKLAMTTPSDAAYLPDSCGDLPRPGTPPDWDTVGVTFRELCEVVAKLRSPEGCPWDREQTLESIKPYTLEETYELLEAIDSGDNKAIVEELGDVLLQVLLDAQIGADEGRFGLSNVVDVLTRKLVERHPHVFGDVQADTPAEVSRNWDRIKQQEKKRNSALDGIPSELPQLARAARISKRAARVGYDFPHRAMLFDKLREELDELRAELDPEGVMPELAATVDAEVTPDEPIDDLARQSRIEDELGDVLFVLANIARRWQINPEEALRKSNRKFIRRFSAIETALAERGQNIQDATLREMEDLYQDYKQRER